jgi:ribosomal protein S12 methylthiotransferase
MIDAIASLEHIVNYIDIPLQHVSDGMLSAMRRNVTGDQQRALMNRLRDRIPGVAIRTTFITGFPGETEEDHQELLGWIRDFQFDAMGVFQYSQEAGTVAGTMENDPALCVPADVKARREEELMLAQQEIAFENTAYLAEQTAIFDVLIDGPGRDRETDNDTLQVYTGRCYHQAPQVDACTWVLSSRSLAPGELIRCTIIDSDGYDLVARPLDELEAGVSLPVIS